MANNTIAEKQPLPPELDFGNVEYKLKIVSPCKKRFEHLVTQLKWRLREGNGEAIYKIGVEDGGSLIGITKSDMDASVETLKQMAQVLGATVKILNHVIFEDERSIAEVSVRKTLDENNDKEARVAVLGGVDAGKSTLLGLLTQGTLDNGRGKARLNMFRHLHEIQSGRTSSISHEILGFNSKGEPITYGCNKIMTAEDICKASVKLIEFLDLAGHKKYIRTTIKGLSGYSPHYVLLVISSTAGVMEMTREHLTIALALKIPFFVVITKTDLISSTNITNSVKQFLKENVKHNDSFVIKNFEDAISIGENYFIDNIVPIFCVSCVTGDGIDLLLRFLYALPVKLELNSKGILEQELPVFEIDENFKCLDVGQVFSGLLMKGVLKEGDEMQIGPFDDGCFKRVNIKSIHRNRVPCLAIHAGQSATINLDISISNLRNGMVLLNPNLIAIGCLFFKADIFVLSHTSQFATKSQITIHIGNIRQIAIIVEIVDREYIQTNEKALALFKFKLRPEYVNVGDRILFREGMSKGIGKVTQVFPLTFQP